MTMAAIQIAEKKVEAATRSAKVRALVSDACVADTSSKEPFEYAGPLNLRGRTEALNVWQIK